VAGIFAFAPIERVSTVHGQIIDAMILAIQNTVPIAFIPLADDHDNIDGNLTEIDIAIFELHEWVNSDGNLTEIDTAIFELHEWVNSGHANIDGNLTEIDTAIFELHEWVNSGHANIDGNLTEIDTAITEVHDWVISGHADLEADVGDIKTETDKIQMMKDDVESIKTLVEDDDPNVTFVALNRKFDDSETILLPLISGKVYSGQVTGRFSASGAFGSNTVSLQCMDMIDFFSPKDVDLVSTSTASGDFGVTVAIKFDFTCNGLKVIHTNGGLSSVLLIIEWELLDTTNANTIIKPPI